MTDPDTRIMKEFVSDLNDKSCPFYLLNFPCNMRALFVGTPRVKVKITGIQTANVAN